MWQRWGLDERWSARLQVLLAFSVCLSPVIAKVNAFFLIQTSLSLGTGGKRGRALQFPGSTASRLTGPNGCAEHITGRPKGCSH